MPKTGPESRPDASAKSMLPATSTPRKIAIWIDKDKLQSPEVAASIDSLRDDRLEPHLFFTRETTDLAHDMRTLKRDGFERVLVCGGDGTLHHVIQEISRLERGERLPLAAVPLGTANDFAKGVGLTHRSFAESLRAAATAPYQRIDMAWVNGHPFVNVASGGIVARTTTDVSPRLKSVMGRYAYHLNALLTLHQPEEYHWVLRGTGWQKQMTGYAFAVGNNSRAGGGFKVAPEAKLNDGLFDLLVIPTQSRLELTALAAELLKENPDLSRHKVFYRQESDLLIDSAEDLQVNLDGEPIHGRQFHFQIEPRSVDMVFSPEGDDLPFS